MEMQSLRLGLLETTIEAAIEVSRVMAQYVFWQSERLRFRCYANFNFDGWASHFPSKDVSWNSSKRLGHDKGRRQNILHKLLQRRRLQSGDRTHDVNFDVILSKMLNMRGCKTKDLRATVRNCWC
jgi:hypothetical protein